MQVTSSGWAANVAAAFRNVGHGVLISWMLTPASGVQFFTIGTSKIGGTDMIKSGGTTPAFFDKYAYTDYTHYATSWNVDRRLGQYPYGTFLAQVDLQLDNSSKLFLPGYDATIGSGILPGRPLRISASIDGESMGQIVAFTGTPQNTISNRQLSIHGYDVFQYLNSMISTASGVLTTSGVYANQSASAIIGDLLAEQGFSANQYVLDQSLQSAIGYLAPANLKVGDIIQELCEAEQALSFADENGIIRFWNRQHFLTQSGTSQTTFTYTNISDLNYAQTPIINDVKVTAYPRKPNVTATKIWELQSTQTIQPNATLLIEADFTDDFGALPTLSVSAPLPHGSANDSHFIANSAQDGSGSDVTTSLSVTRQWTTSTSYFMVFTNSTAATVYLTQLVLYGIPIQVSQVIVQRYQDTASIALYGTNPQNNGDVLEIENDYIQDPSQAYTLAYTLVNQYSKPLRRYENVPVFANPALQIGDLCTLTNPDTGETLTIYITGIRTQMGSNGNLAQYIDFEARTILTFFTIGTSKIGGTDSLAP